ncbi:hypothetical protein Leryth_002243 [Lithospermum erythrorhizon]|nr:hypothetical protein Leryth_002243 [Lithospermum erythrorhizon]
MNGRIGNGDLMMNGAFFTQSGEPLTTSPFTEENTIKYQPGSEADLRGVPVKEHHIHKDSLSVY